MNRHQTQYLGALLDGELRGWRRWRVTRHLRSCAVCAAEYRQLHHVQSLLREQAAAPAMPVSATEFWQTVRLDIETSETRDLRLAQPRLQWGDWLGQHQWAVATATALFVVVLGLGGLLARTHRGTARRPVKVVEVNTDIPQTAVTTLYSPKAGVTVLWTSGLPWTKDVNAMHNAFANLDT